MFRKLVSNLPFSPALVGQLGFYAKRLKKEEATRRLGLVFTALALIVQSFAVFSPPESANASNANDMIYGGVSSKSRLLDVYDKSARGSGDLKDILTYAGITRAELAAVKETTINSRQYGTDSDGWLSWGRTHRFSASDGEAKHIVPRASASGATSTLYSRPLWLYDKTATAKKYGITYGAFVGKSANGGTFAIMKDCGNLVTRKTPRPVPAGAFIAATCDTIRGYAYDARNRSQSINVYLYFNGPPGRGERVGPIKTSSSNNNFSYAVPAKYKTSKTTTKVYGVLVPLAGWNDSSVQFKNTATIPGNCVKPQPTPSAACTSLKKRLIERTKFALVAKSTTENGATIKGYTFTVKDSTGKVVAEKKVASTAKEVDSGMIELKTAGEYTATVVVSTSLGDKTDETDCATTITVSPPEKCPYNPALPKNHEDCTPCPGNPQIWSKDEDCTPSTTKSKEAKNLTQDADASSVAANSGDRIQYTIYVENIGQVPAKADFVEELEDVMEYATIQDNGGGTYNADSKVLSWNDVTLAPGERQSRSFTVVMKSEIPATPQGASEPGSYDCIVTNAFGNTVTIDVNCPEVKQVEGVVKELPSTGPGENMLFAGGVLSVATFFWARSRQMNKEVRLIRKDFNAGTI